ncbi:hypothetical protein HN358_03585 [Candidatus Uhrbacteria bacterium]|nr:hypothetical protein [Candidatus Uhrbacteria bacterium]MBT7717218.1 hypothetical protein [Candidatus Uhrbacteria bacterium]
MTKVDLTPLKELFIQQGRQEIWPEVEQMLAPWVRIAQIGTFTLKPEGEIDKGRYRAAVAAATGKEITEVVFASCTCLVQRPRWMTQKVYRRSLSDSIGNGFDKSLLPSVRYNLNESLRESFSRSFSGVFENSFWCIIHEGLGDIEGHLSNGFGDSIFLSILLALTASYDEFGHYKALLIVQQEALGLGFKKDEPTVFIALCA